MNGELSIFCDLDQGRLVQSFLSTLHATLPRFVFGDSIPVSFRPLKSNGNNSINPWSEVDLTDKTVRIAIGNPAGAATGGTFSLTYGANTTSALGYNADGAAIQSALNALASITAEGGVVVTRAAQGGAFRVAFNTAGARTAITADTSSIYPSSGAEVRVVVEGTVSVREVVLARVEALPAAYAELGDEFPLAAATVVNVRTGSGSVGAIISIGFPVLPYGGTYRVTIGGQQSAGIPWDAESATLQASLELLSSVGAGKATITGEFPEFTINFALSLGNVGTITVATEALIVPKGRAGVINTNTAGMLELLNGSAQTPAKLEIEIYDNSAGTTWTVLQADCTVIDDVIGNSPATTPAFASLLQIMAPGDTAPVNAAAGIAQVETLTLVGSASSTGNNDAQAVIAGSTYTIAVALVIGDSASTVGGKVRAALATLDGVNSQYTVGGTGATITLTKLPSYTGDDATLAIQMATTRYPAQSASVNTTAGAAPIAPTEAPPYIRVAGGFLYIQDAGTWKRAALGVITESSTF